MHNTEILKACLDRLIAFDASPPIPIAHPGVSFDPPSDSLWFAASSFPNEPGRLSWDDGSFYNTFGFFQVLVYDNAGIGQIRASDLADQLIAHFPESLNLGPVCVRKRPWQSPAVTLPDKIYVPVTIPWRGII